MKVFFGVKINFDKDNIMQLIENSINFNKKGYVCAVERNVITNSHLNESYNKIINEAIVNICDGSVVATIINLGYWTKYKSYTMADLFLKLINKKKYKQIFLGNTPEILSGLKDELSKIDPKIKQMTFRALPFNNVEDFDYKAIAKNINKESPDIIWVSLGAPKQEIFISNLNKYLDKGIMFGVGALFNFYSGFPELKRAPKIFLKLKLEWLYRIYQEPKKNLKRNFDFIKIIPSLFITKFKNK